MDNITQLFNTYFDCQKQFNYIGEKIFKHILDDYPYIFNNHKLEYNRTRVTNNNLFLCYYDGSVNRLNPYFEFQIPIDIVNNDNPSVLEQWLQQKNVEEQNMLELMENIRKQNERETLKKLKEKYE